MNLVGMTGDEKIPQDYSLYQNFPNPFNPSTTIGFGLPAASAVSLTVYDADGRVVERLLDDLLNAGIHKVTWNADSYSSGIYFYTLKAGNFTETKKMILVK